MVQILEHSGKNEVFKSSAKEFCRKNSQSFSDMCNYDFPTFRFYEAVWIPPMCYFDT